MADRPSYSIPGVIPIKGDSARRMIDTATGEVLSRREFVARAQREESYKQYVASHPREAQAESKGHNFNRYEAALNAYVDKVNRSAAREGFSPISKSEARRSAEFKALYHETTRASVRRDRSSKGAWARALVDLGLRDESWDWDVGDTPGNV